MNKKSFETIILNLQLAHKKSRELYKLGVDLMEYDESYEFVINELFRAAFNVDQLEWIDWFLYERESLTHDRSRHFPVKCRCDAQRSQEL